MWSEILIVLGLIALNGVLALAEMAVVSSRKGRLKSLAKNSRGAQAALRLAEEPSRFLSTVQIGITAVGVLSGAFGGATIAAGISDMVSEIPELEVHGDAIGIAVVVIAITFLSLIFGELVPKRIALRNPEPIAAMISRPMLWLSKLAAPVVWLLARSSDLVLKPLGLAGSGGSLVTDDEIRHLVEEATEAGTINDAERDLVSRALRMGDKLARDVMTPRPQMIWLDAEDSLAENLGRMKASPHSRFPVMRGGDQQVIGIVEAKDLMAEVGLGADVDLFKAMHQPNFVPETASALQLLDTFRGTTLSVAIVIDEYGVVQGLVTPIDILRAVIGEGPAGAEEEPPVIRREDGSYLIDALLPADELRELLKLGALPGEADNDFATLAGMMLTEFGRLPRSGDYFEWNGYRFEVVDMDGARIDKVLVTPPDENPSEGNWASSG